MIPYSRDLPKEIADLHASIFGKTRVGKSKFLEACARAAAKNPLEGMSFIDIHGESARGLAEWLSNPANGCSERSVHIFSATGSLCFGVNLFETADDSPEACHDAANMWASAVENVYG